MNLLLMYYIFAFRLHRSMRTDAIPLRLLKILYGR
jgi:hypothetical protein